RGREGGGRGGPGGRDGGGAGGAGVRGGALSARDRELFSGQGCRGLGRLGGPDPVGQGVGHAERPSVDRAGERAAEEEMKRARVLLWLLMPLLAGVPGCDVAVGVYFATKKKSSHSSAVFAPAIDTTFSIWVANLSAGTLTDVQVQTAIHNNGGT